MPALERVADVACVASRTGFIAAAPVVFDMYPLPISSSPFESDVTSDVEETSAEPPSECGGNVYPDTPTAGRALFGGEGNDDIRPDATECPSGAYADGVYAGVACVTILACSLVCTKRVACPMGATVVVCPCKDAEETVSVE
ncbi:hypothetical protein DQ04_00211080 [Trypanosoma grayi]|uniref:hypothetical protein n=1 Tax=Trypanosoma grayi TaxID=71804 RepID=UPI0004F4930F|nr:hypothetical protein DQ04_00211080 [Trypanosoma grayi]KEG15025.1 hypothetical protein DQ04_00211080 [Trypanosoma grayi]